LRKEKDCDLSYKLFKEKKKYTPSDLIYKKKKLKKLVLFIRKSHNF